MCYRLNDNGPTVIRTDTPMTYRLVNTRWGMTYGETGAEYRMDDLFVVLTETNTGRAAEGLEPLTIAAAIRNKCDVVIEVETDEVVAVSSADYDTWVCA